ncbi:halocyanin, partial [Halobacteriales archaeon QH_8_67_27]
MNRRDFLRTAGGAAGGASAAAVGAGTAVAAQEEEGGGGNVKPEWPSYVEDAQDGSYEDLRGESEVTVEV